MPGVDTNLSAKTKRHYKTHAPDCALVDYRVESLSDYFAVLNATLKEPDPFWFRGHGNLEWSLTPSALRYPETPERDKALALLADFKRYWRAPQNLTQWL